MAGSPPSADLFMPIADPALYYPVRDDGSDPLNDVARDTDAELSLGQKIMEGIVLSLFQKYRVPCPWCSHLLPVLLSAKFQRKIFLSQNLTQYLPRARPKSAAYVTAFYLSFHIS
jgi:hypothetical protein